VLRNTPAYLYGTKLFDEHRVGVTLPASGEWHRMAFELELFTELDFRLW
jgi:hypothetical protein